VIHVAQLPKWEKSFHYLSAALSKSGLYDELKTIHILCTNPSGQVEKSAYFSAPKYTVINAGNSDQFERPSLWFAKHYSFPKGSKILYLHSKGLRWWGTAYEQNIEDWIFLMLHWNVMEWRNAVAKLDEYDTYGCNYLLTDEHPAHYSGNFWWANHSYLQTCSSTIGTGYNDPEFWLLAPGAKHYSAFQSGLEGMGHYNGPFPKYREVHSLAQPLVLMNAHVGECTFAGQCKKSVEAYAKLHGYNVYHEPATAFPGDVEKSYHKHFWRSLVVQHAAKAYPEAQWFVWLDSDIYINSARKDTRLEDLLEFDPFMLYYTTHEKPWGIDLINTGFKVVNRNALCYEQEIWESRDTIPWNTFTFEQLTLWNKIFPRIPGRFCIKENKELNCIIKAYKSSPHILAKGVFMHMCNMTREERDEWAEQARANGSML